VGGAEGGRGQLKGGGLAYKESLEQHLCVWV
jgi:hypothetical protein